MTVQLALMNYKELDVMFAESVRPYFSRQNFTGRGKGTAIRWERTAFDKNDLRHIIATPCAPVREGGAAISCGGAIRFEVIEKELGALTQGSNCFKPSKDTATIGTSLERLVKPQGGLLLRWILHDEASVVAAGNEVSVLVSSSVIPWLESVQDYRTAYETLLKDLAARPREGCVTAFRAFLLGTKLGLSMDDLVVRVLQRTVSEDDVGADVCHRILATLPH